MPLKTAQPLQECFAFVFFLLLGKAQLESGDKKIGVHIFMTPATVSIEYQLFVITRHSGQLQMKSLPGIDGYARSTEQHEPIGRKIDCMPQEAFVNVIEHPQVE